MDIFSIRTHEIHFGKCPVPGCEETFGDPRIGPRNAGELAQKNRHLIECHPHFVTQVLRSLGLFAEASAMK